jgi:hypothetical protein
VYHAARCRLDGAVPGAKVKIPASLKYALKAVSNVHRQGPDPNIFLFATARGGSTWVMEILASQPGIKYYDEPFNIRRDNVQRTGLFPTWETLMPDTGDPERITGFLEALAAGRHPAMNPPPFRRNHRWRTSRIVFKIHEAEHLMGTIAQRCNGTIVYLLRHPIPTTQSRRVFPRLELFAASPFYERLFDDPARVREIRAVAAGGTHLQRGIVSWAYENLIPLTRPDFDGLVVSYEELLLNPERSCDLLLQRLNLPDRAAMLNAFDMPAANITMSNADTLTLMNDEDHRRRRAQLVLKWKGRVSAADEAEVTRILDLFGLDVYDGTRALPSRRYLHFDDTEARLAPFLSSAAAKA